LDGTVKVIQISDTHLFSDDEFEIFGVKSNIKFKEVMKRIFNEDSHNADMILLTGDMSQDETAESYRLITENLSTLDLPVYWIPGNHDDLEKLTVIFQKAKNFNRVNHLTLLNWHFIFLNTKIEGRDDGYLSHSELSMLKDELRSSPADKKIAIVMHHHPTPVGTPLIDNYILKNSKDFWDIVIGTNVRLIICGHVHGDYQLEYNNIMIESSPVTCLQWIKGIEQALKKKHNDKDYVP